MRGSKPLGRAGLTAVWLVTSLGTAVADDACPRFSAGAAAGYVSFPFSDDDTFSGPLVSAYAGGRPQCGFMVALRIDHTADTVADPFDSARDRDDRYLVALPSLRLGSRFWFELGVGAAYRWRHYHDGSDDDGVRFAFDLSTGATLAPRDWIVRPELSIGLLSGTGLFVTVGASY